MDIHLSFKGLSKTHKNIVKYEDLQNFLSVYRVAVTDKESEYLINLYSSKRSEMDFERQYKIRKN